MISRIFQGSPFFFFNDTSPTEIYTLSLHDPLPISPAFLPASRTAWTTTRLTPSARFESCRCPRRPRSEEHTSELQSRPHLVCRLLLEKKTKSRRQECM